MQRFGIKDKEKLKDARKHATFGFWRSQTGRHVMCEKNLERELFTIAGPLTSRTRAAE